jgi:hypothetical protein
MLLFLGALLLLIAGYFGRELARANHYIVQSKASGGYEAREALVLKAFGLRILTSCFVLAAGWCLAWALIPAQMGESWSLLTAIAARVQH